MSSARPPKVFISYSHDSAEHEQRVLNLANRLRPDGIDAAIDQYETSPREGWPVWMERQIRESDFVLVVCTPPYLSRAERREEQGVGKGAIWETALTLQYLYEASANNERFIPIVFARENITDIPVPLRSATYYLLNDEGGFQRLLRRLRNQPEVERPPVNVAEPPEFTRGAAVAAVAVAKTFRPWNVPHSRNEAFTGREEILTQLCADLEKKNKQALFGLGGVGKTQIAVEYACRQREEYTAVLWTFADSEQSVRGGFSAIAKLLDLPEKDSAEQAKVTGAVKSWLEQNQGWLLVLDNADDPALLKPFLPQQGKGHILLTSRAHTFHALGILTPCEIDVLSKDEAREFLLRRTGKDANAKSFGADALARELGYLPLALEQAAAYIVENGTNFESYLAGFKKQRLKLIEKQGPVLGNDEKAQQKRTVTTTWSLNFADIEKQSPASADLLRLSAFLAPDAIPLELLEKGGKQLTKPLADKLAEAADNPLIIDELLSPLLRFSLVRRAEEKRTYSIHPLLQEVVRHGLSKKEQKDWAERTVRALNAAFPDVKKFENWPAVDRLLPHALACDGLIKSWGLEFVEAAWLLNQTAYYLEDRAEYAQAEPLHRRALAIYEKALGPEHSETATSLNNLAVFLWAQGKLDEAEPLHRRVLAIREKSLGPEHTNTATSLNNLAALLKTQGKLDQAEPLQRRALAIDEKVLGPEHPDTATDLNNLAELLRAQGKLDEAEPLHRRALAIREKALGPEHPHIAQSLNNLADLLRTQGKLGEAEPLHRRALAIHEKTLGPEHPSTASSLNNLADLLRAQGKLGEAEPLHRRALAIREKGLGPEHPGTATSLNNLAALLKTQGKLDQAEPLQRRALAIYEKVLRSQHPYTVIARNNLIRLYRNQGRNAEADALEKSAKEKT